jgi:hypothetical protein
VLRSPYFLGGMTLPIFPSVRIFFYFIVITNISYKLSRLLNATVSVRDLQDFRLEL